MSDQQPELQTIITSQPSKTTKSPGISPSRVINTDYLSTLNDFYKCNICFNIMVNPTDCGTCGHSYCYDCITSHNCPYGCETKNLKPSSSGIKALLSNLIFKCENLGCTAEIPYSDILFHDVNCDYQTVECPHKGCGVQLARKDLEQHIKDDCAFTLVQCQYCSHEFIRAKIKEHESMCKAIGRSLNGEIDDISKINIGDTKGYLEALSLNVAKIVKEKRQGGNDEEGIVKAVESVFAKRKNNENGKDNSEVVEKVTSLEKNIGELSEKVKGVTEEIKNIVKTENENKKEGIKTKVNTIIENSIKSVNEKFGDIKSSIEEVKNNNQITIDKNEVIEGSLEKIIKIIEEIKTMMKSQKENIVKEIQDKIIDIKSIEEIVRNNVSECIKVNENKDIIKENSNTSVIKEKESIIKEITNNQKITSDKMQTEITSNYTKITSEISSLQSKIEDIKTLISSIKEDHQKTEDVLIQSIQRENKNKSSFSMNTFSFDIEATPQITKNSVLSFANESIESPEKNEKLSSTISLKIENAFQNIQSTLSSDIDSKFITLEKKIEEDFDNKFKSMFRLKYCLDCEKVDYFYAFIKCASCNGDNCKNCILLCSICKRLICRNCTVCPRCNKQCANESRVICSNCNTEKKLCYNCV